MKSRLILLILSIVLNQAFALDKNLENQILTTVSQQALDAQQLIDEVGRDKISDIYFQPLKESYVALAQLKAEPIDNKAQKSQTNAIFSSLHHILYPKSESLKSVVGTGNGIIRGFVTLALTGEPISNQTVRLYDSSGSFIQSTSADNVGRYTFLGLASGSYVILVDVWSNSPYIDTAYPSTGCGGGLGQGCQISDLTTINLGVDEVLENIDIFLIEKSHISGHISNALNGSTITRSTRVELYNLFGNRVSVAYTNFQGDYLLTAPSEGDYYVVASTTGYFKQLFNNVRCPLFTCDFNLGTLVPVVQSQNVSGIDLALEKYANMSGVVSDAEIGGFISHAKIVITSTNSVVGQAYTNAQGEWEISSLHPGDYQVSASHSDYLAKKYVGFNCYTSDYRSCFEITGTIISHNVINDTGIDIALSKGARISGVVTNNTGDFLANVGVNLYYQTNAQRATIRTIYTNDLGEYEILNLGDASFYAVASSSIYEPQLYNQISCVTSTSCNYAQGTPVSIVNLNNVTGIDFQLAQRGTVSGQVLDELGSPLSYMSVSFRNSNGYTFYVQTDNDGFYYKTGLDNGEYQVYVSGASQYIPETYNNVSCDDEYCQGESYVPINVAAGIDVTNIDFQLSKKGLVHFDLQSNSANALVGNFRMNVYNAVGQYQGRFSPQNVYLNEGDYYFVFSSYSNFVNKVYGGASCFDNCDATTGLLVHVAPNSEQTLTMNIDEKFHLNITSNVSGIYSRLYNQALIQDGSFSLSNTTTTYYFNNLDSKYLKFTKQGFYSQIYNNLSCLEIDCDVSQGQLIIPQLNSSLDISLVLTSLATLSGRITDSSNNPVEGRNVFARSSLTQSSTLGYSQTNANGEYAILGLTPGEVYISVESTWNQPEFVSRTYYGNIACEENDCSNLGINPVTVSLDDNLTNIDIQMINRGNLSGSGVVNVFNETRPVQIIAYLVKDGIISQNGVTINSENGQINPVYLRAGEYKLVANPNYEDIYTAYPDVYCLSSTCASLASSVSITNDNDTFINSFLVHQKGRLKGIVRDALTSNVLEGIEVDIYQNNSLNPVQTLASNLNGEFEFVANQNSQYKILSGANNQWGRNNKYLPQLYNNLDCFHGLGVDCILSQGDAINVAYDTIMTIDINLNPRPKLNVSFKDSVSNNLLRMNSVYIYDESGTNIDQKYGNSSAIMIDDLLPGIYYLMVSSGESGYKDTAYPDVYCPSYETLNCDLNLLTPVTLAQGGALQSVNVKAPMLNGISGYVVDKQTGIGIAGVVIDLWAENGDYRNTPTISELNGGFVIYTGSFTSNYFLSTDTNSAYINEVFQDVECQQAAILGSCDVTQGMLINVPQNNTAPIIVNIELSTNSDQVFINGFE